MSPTRLQKIWDLLDILKVTLDSNPHIDINEARNLVLEIEKHVKKLRKKELKNE